MTRSIARMDINPETTAPVMMRRAPMTPQVKRKRASPRANGPNGAFSRSWSNRTVKGIASQSWINGSTRAGKVFRATYTELVAHVGGHPTATQKQLIERLSWIAMRLDFLDEKIAKNHDFTISDANYYLAWANAQARMLRALGLTKPTLHSKPRHVDVLAEVAGNE